MADNRFENAEAEFYRLRGQLAAGRITKSEFEGALKALMFQDLQGRHWMISADTGTWYVHDGKQWTEASPQPIPGEARVVAAPVLQSRGRGGNRILLYGAFAAVLLGLCAIAVLAGAWYTGILRINPDSQATATLVPYLGAYVSPTPQPIATPTATAKAPATLPATSVPTSIATSMLTPTAIATATPTATSTSTPTAIATATPTTTAIPPRPGLYVTNLRLEPPEPKHREEVGFYPTFLNATDVEQKYRWAVYIYRPENMRNSFGETSKSVPTIPVGTSEQRSLGSWKLGSGGECDNFLGRVEWTTEDNERKPFYKPDGSIFESFFSVCH